jgi:hypothetical protein
LSPQPRNTFNVAVVGAGLSGLCLAHSLKRSGIDVHVYERDDSAETRGQGYRITLDPERRLNLTTDNSQKAQPSPALKRLEKLDGTWTVTGRTLDSAVDNIKGRVVINWLAGGFFLEQRGEMEFMGTRIESLEVVYHDPTVDTFPSTVYASISGTPLPYSWDVRDNAVTHSGYGATFTGTFSDDGNTLTGGWRPDGRKDAERNVAYDVVMTRVR